MTPSGLEASPTPPLAWFWQEIRVLLGRPFREDSDASA